MKLGRSALWSVLVGALALPLAGAIFFRLYSDSISERINQAVTGMQSLGPSAWVAVTALQMVIAISGVLPASVLGVAAGAVYGVFLGFVLTALGTMFGAAISFGLARTMLRPFILRRFSHKPYLARLDRAIDQNGWRTVCLLRLSPVMPFAIGSYALGLTSITFWRYWLGSLGSLPALLGYVILGSIAKHSVTAISDGVRPFQLAMMGIGIAATLWFILHAGKIVKEVMSLDDEDGIGDGREND